MKIDQEAGMLKVAGKEVVLVKVIENELNINSVSEEWP